MNPKPNAQEILINSREDLRKALSMSAAADIPEVGESFRATRAELDSLVTEWVQNGVPTPEQMTRIREFVQKKTAAIKESQKDTGKLREQVGAAVAPAAVLSGAAEAIGPDARQVIADLGIADDVRDGINELIEEDPNASGFDKIIGKFLKKLMTMLAGVFGIKLDKDEGVSQNLADTPQGAVRNTVETVRETGGDVLFDAGARLLIKFVPEKGEYSSRVVSDAPMVLSLLKDRTYGQISTIYDESTTSGVVDAALLAQKLWLSNTDPETVRFAVSSLLGSSALIDGAFSSMESPVDWRSKSLSEIIRTTGVELGAFARAESIQTEEDARRWMAQMLNPEAIQGEGAEGIRSKYDSVRARFTGLTPSLILKLKTLAPETLTEDFIRTRDEKEQDFLRNTLMPFRDQFKTMLWNPAVNLGMSGIDGIVFSPKNPIKMGELLAVFIRTGGHPTFESMNGFEHISLYQSVAALLWERDQEKASTYVTTLMNSPTTLPPHAKKFIEGFSRHAENEILEFIAMSFNVTVGALKGLTPTQLASVLFAGGVFLYIGRWLFMTSVAAKMLAATAMVSGALLSLWVKVSKPNDRTI